MSRPLAVVILAAGLGTRMASDLPKVMHRLAGQPMLAHVIATATALDPDRIVVVSGPQMADVAALAAPHQVVVQRQRLGTAHALLAARTVLGDFDGDLLVLFGDTPLVQRETLAGLVAARTPEAAVAVLGFYPDDPDGYGRLVCAADETEALLAIVEHRDASAAQRRIGLCNAGVMCFDAVRGWVLLAEIGNDNAKGEYYLTDVVAQARRRGWPCTRATAAQEEVMGINSRAQLARAEAVLQDRLRARAMAAGATLVAPETVFLAADTRLGRDVVIHPHAVFGPGVCLGDRVEVKSFSHLEACRVESDVVLGPYARLRPGAEIAAGARIGNFVEIKKARIDAGAKVNHLSYIGDAEIGAGANIGAGTITCNYDGFAKARTEIGAGAFIGSNSALVAPLRIGAGAIVGAGSTITDDVGDDAIAVTRAEKHETSGAAARFRARRRAKIDKA